MHRFNTYQSITGAIPRQIPGTDMLTRINGIIFYLWILLFKEVPSRKWLCRFPPERKLFETSRIPDAEITETRPAGMGRKRQFVQILRRSAVSIQRTILKILKTSALEKVDILRLFEHARLLPNIVLLSSLSDT